MWKYWVPKEYNIFHGKDIVYSLMKIRVLRKIDTGMIMLEVSQDDLASLEPVLQQGLEKPTIKISVYKNRRGRYKDILLWCKSNRGTCKIEPIFVTNYQYELLPIEDLKIKVKSNKVEASAF